MAGLVKVSDAKTGKLIRIESDTGKVLAKREGKNLVLTPLGRKRDYVAKGLKLYTRQGLKSGNPAF